MYHDAGLLLAHMLTWCELEKGSPSSREDIIENLDNHPCPALDEKC